MNDLVVRQDLALVRSGKSDFVTIMLAGQILGIPVLEVHDVLNQQQITRIPRAPEWVAGVLNLRGKIVTAINLRSRLDLPPPEEGHKTMSIVVEYKEEPYSLQIDSVGEVLSLDESAFEKNPVTLDPRWRSISKGIFRLERELLPILDVEKLLAFESNGKAA